MFLKNKKKAIAAVVISVLVITAVVLLVVYKNDILDIIYQDYEAPAPTVSAYEKMGDEEMINGDFYVSTKGSDENDGTKEAPFLTIEKAIEAGGTTIRSYTSSLGVTGLFQLQLNVHTKKNEECGKCGNLIIKTRVSGRGTYICENCQKIKR